MYDTQAMMKEVYLLQDSWLSHYNTQDYTGEWKAIPLRSVGGSVHQAFAQQFTNNVFADTPLLDVCPVIKSVISSFQCDKTSVRLLNLRSGAVVKEHTDPGLSYEEGEIRVHIPICTNESVDFFIEEEPLHPQQGECWYMNFELKHRLANNGLTDRIHLVIDCIVNEWVKNIFDNADDIKRIPKQEKFSHNEQLMIIEGLKIQGTPTALQLAREMEALLNIQ